MKHLLYIVLLLVILCSCVYHKQDNDEVVKWNVGYDPAHPECFDTIVDDNGDSLLIIVGAIDSIM